MKILVVGGAGYIGSALVPALIKTGHEVEVIDLLWFGNFLPKNIKVMQKDLFHCKACDMQGYDQVIFLAGLSNDPMAEYDPAKNFILNGALPAYLAYIAKNAGVKRYIYASSCSVYGYTVDQLYDENAPVTCAYPYGISKLQGERGVLQEARDHFSCIALRQGTVCGHSPRMRMDLIVNTMFKCAMTEEQITINNPAIWRPLYDIRDCVHGFLQAVNVDPSISGVFNVCSGNFTVGQVGEQVKAEVEKLTGKKIQLNIKNIQDFRNYKVSIEKAQKILGFDPKHAISDIVNDLYSNRDYYGDFEREEFYNIRVFKRVDKING